MHEPDRVIPHEESSEDEIFEAFLDWTVEQGLTLYAHQEEAAIELVSGNNVILATPTGSGKSMVAIAAHFVAMAEGRVTYYTAPIKALVSEKFFALCNVFGAENVGMVTGDGSVNANAPIICCTAEILANIALREGADADVGQVVMDEFHFYAEPQRGWAWQVPLLSLPQAQFLLMSATLGDVTSLREDLTRRTGRETALIENAERPVPLHFDCSLEPLHELLEDLVRHERSPIYVVHFTQASALERAQSLLSAKFCTRDERDEIAEAIGAFRFTAGFGKTLSKLVRAGIGVHHAGMLPRYRRLVEQLAQTGTAEGDLRDGHARRGHQRPDPHGRLHRAGEVRRHQPAAAEGARVPPDRGARGAGGVRHARATWSCRRPSTRSRTRAGCAKAGDDPVKVKRVQKVKPREGAVGWTEETYARLRNAKPEALVSRMRVNHAMILNVINQPADPDETLRALMTENHEDERGRARLLEQSQQLVRSCWSRACWSGCRGPTSSGARCSSPPSCRTTSR